jgi:hypothetical protein
MAEEALVENAQPDRSKKAKPVRILPTERIAYQKQLDILRAYAIAAEANNRAVTNADVASLVSMAATTVPHANSFFLDVGLLQKADGGYLPSQDVLNFNRAFAWSSETAPQKLAPAFQAAWFGQCLLPRLAFRSMDENEAIAILAENAAATPDFRGQLVLLLNYLESANLIVREGGQVRAVKPVTAVAAGPPIAVQDTTQAPTRGVETTFARPSSGDGVHFSVTIDVDTKEMGTWSPDRISAFFAGFAQVLAAKGALEKSAAKE